MSGIKLDEKNLRLINGKKKNCVMKNCSIFVATSPKSFYRLGIAVAIFVAVCLLSAKDKGLPIHNGLLHSCRNLTLASSWKGSLSSFNILIFHNMPKSMKDYSTANNSTRTVTLFHETEALLKAADPQQVSQIILQLLQQLDDKVELHVHLIVNSIVVGNNVSGSNIGLNSKNV
jgi:hypothetical protein